MTDQQVAPAIPAQGRGFRAYTAKHLDQLTARAGLSEADRLTVRAVATVLPFRTNEYVVERLIDWDAAPNDPIYRLVFPQPDMLPMRDIEPIADMLAQGAREREVQAAAHAVRLRLNPHPAGQLALECELAGRMRIQPEPDCVRGRLDLSLPRTLSEHVRYRLYIPHRKHVRLREDQPVDRIVGCRVPVDQPLHHVLVGPERQDCR